MEVLKMYGTIVKKLIARNGERELVDSSPEEQQQFIVDRKRPDFKDDSVLCIKFLVAGSESMEAAEESSWFINPIYVERFTIFNSAAQDDIILLDSDPCCSYVDSVEGLPNYRDIDDDVAMEFASTFGYSPCESYGPKMAAEFLPEILVLQPQFPDKCMLEEYQSFYAELLKYSLTTIYHEEKIKLFIKYLDAPNYHEQSLVVPQYLTDKAM